MVTFLFADDLPLMLPVRVKLAAQRIKDPDVFIELPQVVIRLHIEVI